MRLILSVVSIIQVQSSVRLLAIVVQDVESGLISTQYCSAMRKRKVTEKKDFLSPPSTHKKSMYGTWRYWSFITTKVPFVWFCIIECKLAQYMILTILPSSASIFLPATISWAGLAGRCLASQWYSLLFNIHLFSIFTYTWFGTKCSIKKAFE